MVRPFTKPDDVHGMLAAKGILTSEGGATSHAAGGPQFGAPAWLAPLPFALILQPCMTVGETEVRGRLDFG
jgi:pyruvate,orthophosphate dikinase